MENVENYSQGDLRIQCGNRVSYVLVVMDESTGMMKLMNGVGDVLQVYTERCDEITCPTGTFQRAQEQVYPPPLLGGEKDQYRVVGCDIRCVSVVPRTPKEVGSYYFPKASEYRDNMVHEYNGFVAYLYVPVRHIIRNVTDVSEFSNYNLEGLLHRFGGRAPYGFSVLLHELKASPSFSQSLDYDYGEDLTELEKRVNDKKGIEDFEEKEEGEIPPQQEVSNAYLTRRIVFTCVDFGVDHDGVMKLAVKIEPNNEVCPPPLLDYYLFHGAFAEVAKQYPDFVLYKLPLSFVYSVYDTEFLGAQCYENVLRHVVCDTLSRFRVKNIKIPQNQESVSTKHGSDKFYFGFTEDDIHFASNRQQLFDETIPELTIQHPNNDGYEYRSTFETSGWLNMCEGDTSQVRQPKRGHCIYGRVFERPDGKLTLDWCVPPIGMDLLRVYLATHGRSRIFRSLTLSDIHEKMKDKGEDTLASNLFLGLMDPAARNPAIDYVKHELIWSQK